MFYNNRKKWTAKEEQFVNDHAGTMSPEEMAKELHKTATAVKLYMHRKRIFPAGKVVRNLVLELLTVKFTHPEYFTPTRAFYNAVKMSQKRWWETYYGRSPLTSEEYERLSRHFGVELTGVTGSGQLSLFGDGNSK